MVILGAQTPNAKRHGRFQQAGAISHLVVLLSSSTQEVSTPPPSTLSRQPCRGTSLARKRTSLGPHLRPMPRVMGGS